MVLLNSELSRLAMQIAQQVGRVNSVLILDALTNGPADDQRFKGN